MRSVFAFVVALGATGVLTSAPAFAQGQGSRAASAPPPPVTTPAQTGTAPIPGTNDFKSPNDYEIGADDILSIVFWRDKDMSADYTVRPDGFISLPLLNDVMAAGLTPDQLRDKITVAATKYIEDPNVTVIVKQINSRKVFISGQVSKPGVYPLTGGMTLAQLVAMAGGLGEYADREHITVIRGKDKRPDGTPWSYNINYNDLIRRVRLTQNNIELKPGDTVLVP